MIATAVRIVLFLSTVALWAPAAVAQPDREESGVATIFLHDGTTHLAAIDARSGRERLVLRFEGSGAMLLRHIAWDRVDRVRVGGEILEADALRDRLAEFVTVATDGKEPAEPPRPPQPERPHLIRARATGAASLAVDAVPANFDADVPVDGLAVAVFPLDALGRLMPVEGTLEVVLFGERRTHLRPRPVQRDEQFERLGRWVVQLDPQSLGPNGYVVKLPFQAADPAEQTEIDPRALIHARLAVPGQGVFEASAADVRLRPFSPLRQRIEASYGGRYLPGER